jgi:hypothetical protein
MQSPTLLNRASQKIWIFFIDTSDENGAIVYAALAAFVAGMTPKDFQNPAWGYEIGQPPSRIDIL